ncbi:MAG TPA: hypothetical protein VGV15_19730 [Terriglobales bacterium]|nr:hypothetical protein [Terriglobales bacterium]
MIVCNLPPSFFLGSVATAVHTKSFNCFVSTARNGRLLNRWATLVLDGDPAVDKQYKLRGSVGYRKDVTKAARLAAHRELVERLDATGEQGSLLALALEAIFKDFEDRGIIEPVRAQF